jgi:hypothetical protein
MGIWCEIQKEGYQWDHQGVGRRMILKESEGKRKECCGLD